MSWLRTIPYLNKVRRVHALEHATISLLSRRVRHVSYSGLSIPFGFWLLGKVDKEEIAIAAQEALRRLQAGEHQLAIHPRCGTNMAVGGILTGLASFFASVSLHPRENWIEKMPRVVAAATVAMIFAGPVGFAVQEHVTTDPDASTLSLGKINQLSESLFFIEVH